MRGKEGSHSLDVLIPTCNRTASLGVTLTCLAFQTFRDISVIISDQSDGNETGRSAEIAAVIRLLGLRGAGVRIHHHLPRRGMAEQRQFLLERSRASYCLFLDDDLMLEADVIDRMWRAIREEACGFVGCGLIGLSYLNDVRQHEQAVEFWNGPVRPERVVPDSRSWERYRLHNAANLYHLQKRLGISGRDRVKYRVAWVGGCVLYDREKLVDSGGFLFWRELPGVHCGEDVLAQIRVMARYGGCGVLPSGVYHQELPTTLPDRNVIAPQVLPFEK